MTVEPFHNPAMNEDPTRDLLDRRSFEERVFARFDSLDTRIHALEGQAERRALETKPIWERALAEIGEVTSDLGEVKGGLGEIKSGLGEVRAELGEVRAELGEVKERLSALEGLNKPMLRKIDLLSRDVVIVRAEQIGLEDRLEKLEHSNV